MLTLHKKSPRRANVLASQPFFTQNSELLHKIIAGKLKTKDSNYLQACACLGSARKNDQKVEKTTVYCVYCSVLCNVHIIVKIYYLLSEKY